MKFREIFKDPNNIKQLKIYVTDNSWGNSDFQIKGKVPVHIANLKNLVVAKVPGTIESTYDNYIKYKNAETIVEDIMLIKYASYRIKVYKINGVTFDKDYIDTVLYFYPESKIKVPEKSSNIAQEFNRVIFAYRNKIVGVVMMIRT